MKLFFLMFLGLFTTRSVSGDNLNYPGYSYTDENGWVATPDPFPLAFIPIMKQACHDVGEPFCEEFFKSNPPTFNDTNDHVDYSYDDTKSKQALSRVIGLIGKTKSSDKLYPALILWMDHLVGKLNWDKRNLVLQSEPDLVRAGFPLCRKSLIKKIAEDNMDSSYGRWSFVIMTRDAWSTTCSDFCEHEEPNGFKVVIDKTEKFLSQYKNTEEAVYVEYENARAYETWWNLSQLPPSSGADYPPDPGPYKPGADSARLRAINLYKGIIKRSKDSNLVASAQVRSQKLEQKQKSDELTYYYFCD